MGNYQSNRQEDIVEAEDRISALPDSLLHHILSFLDIKPVARTCVLSKRWKHIWTSIPTLVFPFYVSESETDNFMEFVNRTLILRDTSSNIQKCEITTNEHMSASRVHSWIENLVRCNVEDLTLVIDPNEDEPFFIPLSLFTCESLVTLDLSISNVTVTHLPRSFCFPKLTSLRLSGIQFTDDCCWSEQHFSSCPVLRDLFLEECTWLGVRKFCITAPALEILVIDSYGFYDDGLQDCALTIHAPNLVSLFYCGCVAKEYVFSSFETLKFVRVSLRCVDGVPMDEKTGYGAAVSKFVRALSHVRSLLIPAEEDFVNILPVFHDLEKLYLGGGEPTDKLLFPLLKAVPNLRRLTFEERCLVDNKEEDSWDGHMLTAGCMFQYLKSVTFVSIGWNARQMRWLKLILKNAKALKAVKLRLKRVDAIHKEVLESEFLSLPRASEGCKFKFQEY